MTRWWWVRHGPTHQKTFVGWRDVPADLSDRAALERLNTYLPADAVLLSSDLIRASATAAALGRGPASQYREIREFNFGDWDGLHHTEVTARDPDLARRYWDDPGDITPPGGESWNQVRARVDAFVDEMTARYAGRNIIAVAHIGVILTQIQRATRSTPYQALGHTIDNLSVSDMRRQDGVWHMGAINHLA